MKAILFKCVWVLWIGLLLGVWTGCAHLDIEVPPDEAWTEVTIDSSDRVMILAPHPDDEILATAGVIHAAVECGAPVRVVFYTYGDNNVWSFTRFKNRPVLSAKEVREMGEYRLTEAQEAAKEMGLAPENLIFLGYPDYGTHLIWRRHWGDQPPFLSMFTRATNVPYASALSPGAPYKGESILNDLKTVIGNFRPTKLFVSHPADHNVDHRTLYVFTRVALWDLTDKVETQVNPALTHYKVWPSQQKGSGELPLGPPAPLLEANQWRVFPLSEEALERKQIAITKHATQYGYSSPYLRSFMRPSELFGDFPDVLLVENAPHSISLGMDEDPLRMQEELSPDEFDANVDLAEVRLRYQNDEFHMQIRHSKPLEPGARIAVGTFGYRPDVPFPEMPKIGIMIGPFDHTVYDQEAVLPKDSIGLTREKGGIRLTIPLELLGHPDRILAGARATAGEAEVDWAAWRVVWLEKSKEAD